MFPDFFIGGAQKCGTTSLALWLDEHPDLICSQPKETNFFSNRALAELEGDCTSFFPGGGAPGLRFDATTSYMTDYVALENIVRLYDCKPKFIFILKDPVQRAVSAYYHLFKHHADKRELEDVFDNFPDDPEKLYDYETGLINRGLAENTIVPDRYRQKYDNYTWVYRYLYNGLYSRHVARFERALGQKNVLCLCLDKVRQAPSENFRKITDFLGVKPFDNCPDTTTFYNRTMIPRYLYNKTVRRNKFLLKAACYGHGLCRRLPVDDLFVQEPRVLDSERTDALKRLFEDEFDYLAHL